MLKKTFIVALLFLTSFTYASEVPVEHDRVMQLIKVAKEIDATDQQLADAIASDIPVQEFIAQIMGRIRLVAPNEAPKGSPVQIIVDGMPEKAAELWRRHPTYPTDVWFELFDRSGKPINIFWSSDQGPRTFELIVAENGPDVPKIEIASHTLLYGGDPTPPIPPTPTSSFPEPPAPSASLQAKVQPIISLMERQTLVTGDLLNLSEFYFDFADVIRRDASQTVKTTLIFRNTYSKAGVLMFQQTGMQGKYSGLAEIVDGFISDELGLDVVPLDASKAADVLNAVAWAFYQPLKGE